MFKSILRRTVLVVAFGLLVILPTEPVVAEEFEIILLLNPSKKYDSPMTMALIECGYKDGLAVGMVGSLSRFTDTSNTAIPEYDLLVVEVQDVTAYESACLIRGANLENIESGTTVEFDIPELGAQEARNRASDALAVKEYRRALHYLEELIRVDSMNSDSSVQQLIEHCRHEIEQEADRKLSGKEKRAEKKRAPIYHKLGAYFFNHDNYDAARHYLERAVRADKNLEHAKGLLCIIEEGVPCNVPDTAQTIPLEVYPEMIYQHPMEYPQLAKQAGITGLVWVSALIDKSGLVVKTKVGKSSGSMALDQAAIHAAYFNRFQPGIQKGKPIACWVVYKVDFVLDG